MKTAAIIAVLCGSTAVLGAQYNKADPCQELDKKDCMDESACHYQMGERKYWLSRKDSPNHHHEEAGKQSCQMIHMKDRTHLSKQGKQSLMRKFSAHSEWDDMECAEAFYMKDCKDLNQNAVLNGSSGPKCAWNYETGCMNYDGETRVYTIPKPKPHEFLIDLYESGNKYLGRGIGPDVQCYKEDLGAIITGGVFDGPPADLIDTCFDICVESVATGGDCEAYTIEEITVTIQLLGGPGGDEAIDVCYCNPPVGFENTPDGEFKDCQNSYNSYIHPDNSQKDSMITDATDFDCAADEYKREYQYPEGK